MNHPHDNLPLVMVSSVVKDFGEYRQAAARGIEAAGGRPVLVNEDFHSTPDSSRNVCLNAAKASDAYVAVLGERGGWKTPSGKLAVEEEFEEAVRFKKPVFVFVQEGVLQDAEAKRLTDRLSDYVGGRFRETFSSPDDLQKKVRAALAASSIHLAVKTMHTPAFEAAMSARPLIEQVPSLRFVLAPNREGELVDPADIESARFARRVLEIAHSEAVDLLDFSHGTESAIRGDALVLTARDGRSEVAVVEAHESGLVSIDVRIRRGAERGFGEGMVVAEEDIEARLAAAFRFCGRLYDWKDEFGRNQQFAFDCALLELGYHSIERNPQPRSSYSMSGRGDKAVVAYGEPRLVARHDLGDPDDEVRRALVKLKRAAQAER